MRSRLRGPRPSLLIVTLAATVTLLAGCGVESLAFSTPPATPPSSTTSTTFAPDLTGAALGAVSGRTTTTTPTIGPGGATLSGTVLGPQGPVGGATVEADRFVGSANATKRVTTAADGSWTIPAILGGRYRVRAWQSPTLALTTPQIFFLGGTQAMTVDLQVQAYTGQALSSAVNPTSASVGGTIDAVVDVSNQSVGTDGIVNYQPVPRVSVNLNGAANVGISSNPAVTDSRGKAIFVLSCLSPGTSTPTGTTTSGGSTTLASITCFSSFTAPPTPPTTSITPPSSSTSTTTTSVPSSVPKSSTTAAHSLLP
ncbi:MAG: carboxypeptidase-like regulatory domain-containing protein [Actinomycetota bacterium]|nr:carboxypeptidase-like regulatory domain-containing protein [Actinomycetota bacterium]